MSDQSRPRSGLTRSTDDVVRIIRRYTKKLTAHGQQPDDSRAAVSKEAEGDSLHRFTVGGRGVYEHVKENAGREEWRKLLQSPELAWMPKPQVAYGDHESWFTPKGSSKFKRDVLPRIKDLVRGKVEEPVTSRSSKPEYEDEFQKVFRRKRKSISFPADELESLKGRDSIVTHRVSADAGKFNAGDTVRAPWGDDYKVESRDDLSNVKDSPYYGDLTDAQRKLLGRYAKIALLRLSKSEKKAAADIPAIYEAVRKAYGDMGYPVSGDKLVVSRQPTYTNGKPVPADVLAPEASGGNTQNDGTVRINPDYRAVMKHWGVKGSGRDFLHKIIGHELGHHIDHTVLRTRARSAERRRLLQEIARSGFHTVYTDSYGPDTDRRKLDKELLAEYLGHMVSSRCASGAEKTVQVKSAMPKILGRVAGWLRLGRRAAQSATSTAAPAKSLAAIRDSLMAEIAARRGMRRLEALLPEMEALRASGLRGDAFQAAARELGAAKVQPVVESARDAIIRRLREITKRHSFADDRPGTWARVQRFGIRTARDNPRGVLDEVSAVLKSPDGRGPDDTLAAAFESGWKYRGSPAYNPAVDNDLLAWLPR